AHWVNVSASRAGFTLRDRYVSEGKRAVVGCLTTQDGTILARQNGRVMVVGNCPGPVRAAQRPQIVALAMSIRQGAAAPAPERWTSEGMLSLHDLAAAHLFSDVATVLALTARSSPGAAFAPGLARYIDTVFAADPARCPAGVTWHYPGKAGQAATWVTKGQDSLQALSAQLGTRPSAILQVTADVAGTRPLQALAASYINGCFARSALHVPAGAVLFYGAS
ncbi:MAG TPA: hypothetical protein VFY14_08710, partial [Streptomyces sp.]|nr:hypothetical protein [Streptomyces sp.]